MIYLTSDFHFGHQKEFLYGPRGFKNADEMNEEIVKRFNSIVTADDITYVLGDLMLGDTNAGIEYLKQLNGKLCLIRGNHDTDNREELYKQLPNLAPDWNPDTWAYMLQYKHYHFYLSHYPSLCANYDADKPLKTKTINLCGHSHTQDRFADFDKGLIYHVELDAHNCYPISLDSIIEDIKTKLELQKFENTNSEGDNQKMIEIETCPKCGADLYTTTILTYPPRTHKSCTNTVCGWSWTSEAEKVVRVPFDPDKKTTNVPTPKMTLL